jgi:predicted Zn-dependent protease
MFSLALRSLCFGLAFLLPALPALTQAKSTTPAIPNDQDSARMAQLRDQAQQEANSGKAADAIRDYRQILAQQPGWTEGWWNLGMLLYSSNQFEEARVPFSRVTTLAPNFGNGWALLGLSEFEAKDYDDALVHLDRAQSLGIRDDEEIARVSAYHLALLRIRNNEFGAASDLLKSTFGSGEPPQQARIALGLATLRVPLLPQQVDPSREALLEQVGSAAIRSDPQSYAALAGDHPNVPYLHLAWCQALEHANEVRDALRECLAETTISPQSPLPWIEASRLQLQDGDKAAALRSAQTAIRIAPTNNAAQQVLANAEPTADQRATSAQPSAEAPAEAASHPEQRIVQLYANPAALKTLAGDSGPALWQQALQEYMTSDYPHARTDLENWLAANPPTGTAWALLGLCDFELHEYDSALIHLERGARLGLNASTQSLDQARYTYGLLLVHAGRFDEAEPVLARVSNHDDALTQKVDFALGLALLRRAQFPQDVDGADADLVASAGQIAALLEQSQYDKAFPRFQLLIARYPNAPFLHYAYGTALMALSEFDQASAQMELERRISLRSELPCLRLASIALRQDNAAPALRWAQCALELAPGSVDAHYLLGRAAMDSDDLPTAIRHLEIAESLSPESPEIHFNLARAYARAKQPEKAAAERETFTRLNAAKKADPGRP